MEEKKDYSEIGLKAGLEIHQQLNTNKLFCDCVSLLRKDAPLFEVERKLNPVVGEEGEIDIAVKHESEKEKTFVYQVYDTNCLVELDEEPPHSINEGALKIVLQMGLLLNCKIFPVTQVMRKTVIDGSNTSGFQRTTLIGHDGFIETSEGKVRIETIALEEDAARIVSRDKDFAKYKLDRLGIPLIEVTTKPDLKTSNQIKEAALKLGEILRACDVRRGIGTIRQDLNISVKGSERVEIKGFQDPKIMIKTVDLEIERQMKLVNENESIKEVRKSNPDGSTSFLRPLPGRARMYPETDLELLKISRDLINEVKKNLPKLKSEHKSYLDEFGLNDELVKLVLSGGKVEEFKSLLEVLENPQLVAKTLTVFQKEIVSKGAKSSEEVSDILNQDVLEKILSSVGEKISENDVKIVLEKIVQGKTLEEAMEKEEVDLDEEVKLIMKTKPDLSKNAYMGLLMQKFKGKVSGNEVMGALKKYFK
jgi:Glu-tRNA(Gln) amidotransferase subunit E-like FAD-binding protein